MYIPKAFEVTDTNILVQFIQDHSFGILFSETPQGPCASHLPFVIDQEAGEHGVLIGHMAKSNPQWRAIGHQDVLAVFPGPHALITSRWYGEDQVVPTWNYLAVHVYGTFILIDSHDQLQQIIRDTLAVYEPASPALSRLDEKFFEGLLGAIVGFKIIIKNIEGQWKLSQNHSRQRQRQVIDGLKATNDHHGHEIAQLMQSTLRAYHRLEEST